MRSIVIITTCFIAYGSPNNNTEGLHEDLWELERDLSANNSSDAITFNSDLQKVNNEVNVSLRWDDRYVYGNLGENSTNEEAMQEEDFVSYLSANRTRDEVTVNSYWQNGTIESQINESLHESVTDVFGNWGENTMAEFVTRVSDTGEDRLTNKTIEKDFQFDERSYRMTISDDSETNKETDAEVVTHLFNSTNSYPETTEPINLEEIDVRSTFIDVESGDQTDSTTESVELETTSLNASKPLNEPLLTSVCPEKHILESNNNFQAHISINISVLNILQEFQPLLRKYFPKEACNLVVISATPSEVTWTDVSLNNSLLCTQPYIHKLLDHITNDSMLNPDFHNNFLPKFIVHSVRWNSKDLCVKQRNMLLTRNKAFDFYVYFLGTFLLVFLIIMTLLLFLREKTKKKHKISEGVTPNSYQRYTLRGRCPVFLSPELQRPAMIAICNPVFVDETVEPKAKHFLE